MIMNQCSIEFKSIYDDVKASKDLVARKHKMADLQKIVDDLSSLTVLEAAELAQLLEERAARLPVAVGYIHWRVSLRLN